MSKHLKDRLARLHYYSQDYCELAVAALGPDLYNKLRDELPGFVFREMQAGIAALFFRGKDVGDANGYSRGTSTNRNELYASVRAEIVDDIVRRLDPNNDD